MSPEDIVYLQDLASTVMDYLSTYTLRDQHRQAAEGLRGLISLAEGNSSSQPFSNRAHLAPQPSKAHSEELQSYQVHEADVIIQSETAQSPISPYTSHRGSFQRSNSLSDLQDMVLPNNTRQLLERAADIIHRFRDMDGVMFLDASISATGMTAGDASPNKLR
jgi:hypothetical protein